MKLLHALRAVFLAAVPGRERGVDVHLPTVFDPETTHLSTVQPPPSVLPAMRKTYEHQETAPAIFEKQSRWKSTFM